MAKKRCFVISPIGDEHSAVRQEADALLWVARSALEKYNFEVVRVDQIARSTTITNEIIQLIQESELCLIVLTGENANVYYEAGRRHETGRPFVQLIKKGERLPFDVASIRTIIYDDIHALASAARVVEQIQKFIEEFEKGGYGASGTGVSLSTIATVLDRIERKVGQLSTSGHLPLPGAVPSTSGDVLGFLKNPRETFMTAVAQGDLNRAAAILPRLQQLMGPSGELVAIAGILAVQGYEPAAEIVFQIVTDHFDEIREQEDGLRTLQAGVSALVQFYVATDREAEGIARCELLATKVVALPEVEPKMKAHVWNQLQKLKYGAKLYQDALAICEQVLELDPSEPAYVYNASLIYEKLNLTHKATEMVDRYMKASDIDPVHLAHAVETYAAAGRLAEARDAYAKLRQVDPGKAAVVVFDSDLRKKLGL